MKGHWLDEEAQFDDFAIAMISILVVHMILRIIVMIHEAIPHSHNGISMRGRV